MDIWYVIYEYLPTMVFLGDFFFQCKVNKYCFVWLHDYKIRWGLHFAWEGGGGGGCQGKNEGMSLLVTMY